jgi:hypothetical protein
MYICMHADIHTYLQTYTYTYTYTLNMNIIYIYVYIYIFIQYFSEQELGSHHRLCGASHARPGNRGAADACGVRKAAFLHREGAGAKDG